MKNGKKLFAIGAAAYLFASFFVGCNQNAEQPVNANISVKALYSTEKIEKTEDLSNRANGGVEIALAKGESEGDQFAVLSDKTFSYTFTVSDLICGENVIEKENVEVSKMIYTECKDRVNSGVKEAGWYADAVVPMEYIERAKENVMEKDVNNFFWVDVDAPKDAVAGIYTGTVTLEYSNKKHEIPVSVEVFDFTISDTPYMQTQYSIWLNGNFMMYGELESGKEIYNRYYEMLLDYNISAPPYGETSEEFVESVRKYYDRVTAIRLPTTYVGNTNFDKELYEEVMRNLAIASIEDGKNYFSKAFHRLSTIYDEFQEVAWRVEHVRPTIEAVDEIEKRVVEYLIEKEYISDENDELAQSILNLRHNMTAWYEEEWDDVINMYCTTYDRARATTADIQKMTEVMANDNVYWTYGCITRDAYPNPAGQINDYLVSARDLFWFNYEYGIQGDLVWCVNQYCNAGSTIDGMWKPHPDLYEDASHDRLSNGDGYLVYPGINYESQYPFPSHRLLVRRDGIDDHTYLSMLGEKYAALGKDYDVEWKDAKNFVAFLNKQLLGRGASKLNDEAVVKTRKAVSEAIVAAEKTGLAIRSLECINNKIVYEIYTDGSALEINGNVLSGTESGKGTLYKGEAELCADGRLTMTVRKGEAAYTVNLLTAVTGVIYADFDEVGTAEAFKTNTAYGSLVTVDDSGEKLLGKNAKITLSGYDFSAHVGADSAMDAGQLNASYQPSVKWNITSSGKTLRDISSIEYWIYNPQDENITIELFVEKEQNGMLVPATYDKVILYSKQWTKITMDNFNVITLNKSALDSYTHVGFKIGNLIDKDGKAYSYDFLIDEVILRY